MWIARDENEILYLYYDKPVKKTMGWTGDCITDLPDEMFPEVKWEDEEPTEVEITIKKE